MSNYKVRAKRRSEEAGGGYDLSFGKGKGKVTAVTLKDVSNNKWFVDVVGHFKKLSDMKVAWGKWAEQQYLGVSKASGETTPAVATALSPPPPPAPATTSRRGKKKIIALPPAGNDGLMMYATDPFDERFRYPKDYQFGEPFKGQLTPLGMLCEIQAWHERYAERIKSVNHRLALERLPGFNPFSFLRLMLDECIQREISEENEDVE
jgi:hypothetical protein